MIESDIIKGCLKNDPASQKSLYERYYSKILGICLRYSKTTAEAEDMLYEAFLVIFNNIKDHPAKTSFEDWMKQKTVETAIDHLQKNKQNYAIVSTIHVSEKADGASEPPANEDLLKKPIKKEKILKALQELSPAYRTVYNLFMIEEYTHQQIAQLLDISEETSKVNLSKAKFNLKKNLMHQIKP